MPTIDDPVSQELGLERALREALLRGRGWITTAEDRLRVRDSCVTEACREEFSPLLGGPPVRLVVVEAEEWTGQTVYRVEGQAFQTLHDVMERLVLYPTSVTIAWRAPAPVMRRREPPCCARRSPLPRRIAAAPSWRNRRR